MAKKKTKSKSKRTSNNKKSGFKLSNQQRLIFGSFLIIISILLFISFLSFFFTGEADQSALIEFTSRDVKAENWASKLGALLSDFFIQKGFGIASFIISGLIFLSGIYLLSGSKKSRLARHWFWGILITIWISILFGFFVKSNHILGGVIGFEINSFLQDYIGKIGIVLLLLLGLISYLTLRFKISVDSIKSLFVSAKKEISDDFKQTNSVIPVDNNLSDEAEEIKSAFEIPLEDIEPKLKKPVIKYNLKDETV